LTSTKFRVYHEARKPVIDGIGKVEQLMRIVEAPEINGVVLDDTTKDKFKAAAMTEKTILLTAIEEFKRALNDL